MVSRFLHISLRFNAQIENSTFEGSTYNSRYQNGFPFPSSEARIFDNVISGLGYGDQMGFFYLLDSVIGQPVDQIARTGSASAFLMDSSSTAVDAVFQGQTIESGWDLPASVFDGLMLYFFFYEAINPLDGGDFEYVDYYQITAMSTSFHEVPLPASLCLFISGLAVLLRERVRFPSNVVGVKK